MALIRSCMGRLLGLGGVFGRAINDVAASSHAGILAISGAVVLFEQPPALIVRAAIRARLRVI
jgi:hypothetical protein